MINLVSKVTCLHVFAQALFKSKFLQALDMIDENIKNLDGELLTLRRKQKECIQQGGEVSTPLKSEMISGAEYDEISSDDGGFSWETDSLDEDELSGGGCLCIIVLNIVCVG